MYFILVGSNMFEEGWGYEVNVFMFFVSNVMVLVNLLFLVGGGFLMMLGLFLFLILVLVGGGVGGLLFSMFFLFLYLM